MGWHIYTTMHKMSFLGVSVVKNSPGSAGDVGSIPGSGRSGEGNGNPLQCSCLENPRDGGAWWAAVYGVTQSRTRLMRLSSSSSKDFMDFPGGASDKEPACQYRRCQSLGWEYPLEKEMATHSSILAWKISWTEEPGGL